MGSLDLRSSRALIFSNISAGTDSVLRRCQPAGIWCDTAFRMMVRKRKIFSSFLAVGWKPSFAQLVLCQRYMSSQLVFFKLKLVR